MAPLCWQNHYLPHKSFEPSSTEREWELSTIVNCYKGKGGSLERGNYWWMKFPNQILKIADRIIKKLMTRQVDIDDMQFGFSTGCQKYLKTCTFGLWGPTSLRGSWQPSGQNTWNTVINIELVRLPPRQWPKVGRGAAKLQIKK